jgi:ribonuclease HI
MIEVYTDGSWYTAEDRGGYGVVVINGEDQDYYSRGYINTTNNRMELMAVVVALQTLNIYHQGEEAIIYSDSQYVVMSIEKGWLESWAHSNWTRYHGKKLANADLWKKLYPLKIRLNVKFEWIQGHRGNNLHDKADKLARCAANGKKFLIDRRDDEESYTNSATGDSSTTRDI